MGGKPLRKALTSTWNRLRMCTLFAAPMIRIRVGIMLLMMENVTPHQPIRPIVRATAVNTENSDRPVINGLRNINSETIRNRALHSGTILIWSLMMLRMTSTRIDGTPETNVRVPGGSAVSARTCSMPLTRSVAVAMVRSSGSRSTSVISNCWSLLISMSFSKGSRLIRSCRCSELAY